MPMPMAVASAVSSPALYNNHPNNLGRPHQQEAAAVSFFFPPKLSLLKTGTQYSVCRRAPRNVNGWKRRVWIRSELTSNGPSFADRGKDLHEIPRSRPLMAASPAVVSTVAFPPKRSKKSVCLFFCEEMRELAERVALASDSIELRSITWRVFEDGFPNLFISHAQGIRGQHVAFLASFSSPAVIFEQLSVIYALPRLFISSFTLVLPFFPTGSYERMEDEGDVATAFTLARILSNIPISRGGPTSLVIFDIHALQISIAFPDDGAWKRFHKQLRHFPMIICNKVREGDQRIVRLKEGDPRGRHVVIVDDLVQSGGTLIECQKVLAAHGAERISAYVTHGIFPNRSWERFEHDTGAGPNNGLSYFWITDSCPLTVREVKNRAPFEVLSLSAQIASALQI